MGDTYFADRYPYVDVASGGRVDGMINAADRVLGVATETTRIIPGHGPLSTKADLQTYRDMLVTVRDRVAALKAGGKSQEDAVAARPTADLDARWGGREPDSFVGYVYATIE